MIMYKYAIGTVFFLMSLILSYTALAAERPEAMLDNVTKKLLISMKENNAKVKSDDDYIVQLVDRILVPHVDTFDMAKWVIGRVAWEKATPQEQAQFVKEFKYLMIRTYASTLTAYNNQQIEYYPVRGSIDGKNRVQVQSVVKEPGKEAVRIAYRLVRDGDTWRVYDIIIEGVSILKGFQSQFAPEVKTGGVAKAIKVIQSHNHKS
jgi:phospholipid transport system substrate-binding protein